MWTNLTHSHFSYLWNRLIIPSEASTRSGVVVRIKWVDPESDWSLDLHKELKNIYRSQDTSHVYSDSIELCWTKYLYKSLQEIVLIGLDLPSTAWETGPSFAQPGMNILWAKSQNNLLCIRSYTKCKLLSPSILFREFTWGIVGPNGHPF